MNSQGELNQFPLKQLLKIICKQHDAFKYQTGSCIDIFHFKHNSSPFMQKIKKKMEDIYMLTCKVSKLLQECTAISEECVNKDGKVKVDLDNMNLPEKNHQIMLQKQEIQKRIKMTSKGSKKNSSSTKIKFIKQEQSQMEMIHKQEDLGQLSSEIEQKQEKDSFEKALSKNVVFEENSQKFEDDFFDKNLGKQSNISSFMLDTSLIQDINLGKSPFEKDDIMQIKEEHSILRKSENFSSFLLDKKEEFLTEKKSQNKRKSRIKNSYLPSSSRGTLKKKIKKRGHYNICPLDMKMEAIRIARIKSIKEASEMLNIPEKNIKRWIKNGPERKKGAGRKTMDPEMEKKLLEWVAKKFRETGIFPDNKEIKIQAKIFSNMERFKASKGWCDKFLRRNYRFFQYLKNEKKIELTQQQLIFNEIKIYIAHYKILNIYWNCFLISSSPSSPPFLNLNVIWPTLDSFGSSSPTKTTTTIKFMQIKQIHIVTLLFMVYDIFWFVVYLKEHDKIFQLNSFVEEKLFIKTIFWSYVVFFCIKLLLIPLIYLFYITSIKSIYQAEQFIGEWQEGEKNLIMESNQSSFYTELTED